MNQRKMRIIIECPAAGLGSFSVILNFTSNKKRLRSGEIRHVYCGKAVRMTPTGIKATLNALL